MLTQDNLDVRLQCCFHFPLRILKTAYQVVLWKQESLVVLGSFRIEFFRILLGHFSLLFLK